MPPTQKTDSEESNDSELEAAIQMSIKDLQASKNDNSASSSRTLAQPTSLPAKSNGDNDNDDDDDDENFNMELQRAMELSLAGSGGPKSDVSAG